MAAKIKKKVIAKFNGADGSLDFKHGQHYLLEVMSMTIFHKKEHSTIKCRYTSLKSFLENWTDIQVQPD